MLGWVKTLRSLKMTWIGQLQYVRKRDVRTRCMQAMLRVRRVDDQYVNSLPFLSFIHFDARIKRKASCYCYYHLNIQRIVCCIEQIYLRKNTHVWILGYFPTTFVHLVTSIYIFLLEIVAFLEPILPIIEFYLLQYMLQ